MRKLVPSRSWRFILGIGSVLVGLGSLAFSQLVDTPVENDDPQAEAAAVLPVVPGAAIPDATLPDPVTKMRDDFIVTRRALARARQNQSESDRRVRTDIDRMRKDLLRSKEELQVARQTLAADDPQRVIELKRIQGLVDEGLVQLNVREKSLALDQATAVRQLQTLEDELQAAEGIFADSLAGAANPAEVLPAISLLKENLKNTHAEIVASLNESSRREKLAQSMAQTLTPTMNAAERELTAAREKAKAIGKSKELEAVGLRNNLQDAITSVTELQNNLGDSNRLKPEIGELEIGSSDGSNSPRPSDDISELQAKVDASQGLQASLNEDVEKLRSELKQAFRKIISMQMRVEESDKLVMDLERQRNSLLESRNEGITGVDGMNKMVSRLEQELAQAKAELSQARDTLNADKIQASAVINSLSADLARTNTNLNRVKALAAVEGRDAVSMLELEEELNRTKAQLLAIQRKNIETGAGTEDVKIELKNAFSEIMRLRAELSGKEDLEQQLANLESTMANSGIPSAAGGSPEHLNNLMRNLNATKLALQDAQNNQDELRRSLSEEVANLEDKLHQSHNELDETEVEMARKELKFSDLVKDLENELANTQHKLRQAADAHTQGSDVIKIMDDDLGTAQNHMYRLAEDMKKERLEAAGHVRDLQVELETARRRQEAILEEVRSKDETLALKDDELNRIRTRSADLENQLKEVDSMSQTLSELNSVLRSTESVQNVNVDQATALTSQLRDELEQAQVEALLAKQSKEDMKRRSGVRVLALEAQLKDTQNKLELTKGQFHQLSGEGAELIAEYKGSLDQAKEEIRLLKLAGAGETVGTENLAAQLQEAIGSIQVLQYNLTEAEKVNSEVDDLRLRLAASLEDKITDRELESAEASSLNKKMRTLEMELAMMEQAKSADLVNSQSLFSKLKDQLENSNDKVAAMQARLGQSDVSSVETIANLEEGLARSKAEKHEIENRLHQLLEGKTGTVAALERELLLTKSKMDDLEQKQQGINSGQPQSENHVAQLEAARSEVDKLKSEVAIRDKKNSDIEAELEKAVEHLMAMQLKQSQSVSQPGQARIAELERQLKETKTQLENLSNSQPGDGKVRETQLAQQLADTQKRLNELLADSEQRIPPTIPTETISQLEVQLEQARSSAAKLEAAYAEAKKKNLEAESDLEKAIENMMEMQLSGDGDQLRSEMDDLKNQLAIAKTAAGASTDPSEASAIASLQLEIDKIKKENEQALKRESLDHSTALTVLQQEIDQYKKALEDSGKGLAVPSPQEAQLRSDLMSRTEQIVDLQNQLELSRKKLEEMTAPTPPIVPNNNDSVIAANNKLAAAATAIRDLKQDIAQKETVLGEAQADSARLDQDLKNVVQAMQSLKDERDGFAAQVAGIDELKAKLNAATKASFQNADADGRLQRERDELLRNNLSIQTDLNKYKQELLRLQTTLNKPNPSVSEAGNMQAQINSLTSQLQVTKNSESTAHKDFEKVSADLMDAMRKVMLLETNLGQAEGRIKQLENTAPSRSTFGLRSSGSSSSSDGATTKALRDQVLRLQAELEAAQAAGGSRSQTEERLRDTSRQLLLAQRELKQSRRDQAIFKEQAENVEARRRSDVEREKAANQMVTLLNEKLKREQATTMALREGLRKAKAGIAALQNEPGASSVVSSGTRSGPSGFPVRSPRYNPPRTILTEPRPSFARPVSSSPRIQPRPVPSRTSSSDWRSRTRSQPVSASLGAESRSFGPAGRSVSRGNVRVDFEAKVLFLNNETKPASNMEFFLVKGVKQDGIEQIVAAQGIRLPAEVSSGAELWARSIHRGYRYPGVAASIRNAISQAAIGRFRTNSIGEANIENLNAGNYVVIGTAPLGAVGVVWSHPVLVSSDGDKVRLDLRNAAWAK